MRSDIQCLRGIAISSVVLFHLIPEVFPNGFLGVDIFFVISGFLMMWILTKQKTLTILSLADFYYKRVKRIFPLYYLAILLTFFSLHFFLIDVWWPTNYDYYLSAALLFLNYLISRNSADYFAQSSADSTNRNAFLHCWSLCVELQFYLVVPFIFLMTTFTKSKNNKAVILILIGFVSFTCFSSLDKTWAFNMMPARIWQFAIGMISYLLSSSEGNIINNEREPLVDDQKTPEISMKIHSPQKKYFFIHIYSKHQLDWITRMRYLSLISLILLFCPVTIIPDSILRPLITIAAGVLIANFKQKEILSSGLLEFIGDISYTIYLVHFPIVVYFNTTAWKDFFVSFGLIAILSLYIYYGFERYYRHWSWPAVALTLLLLFGCNAILFGHSLQNPNSWLRMQGRDPKFPEEVTKNKAFINKTWFFTENCRTLLIVDEADQVNFGRSKHCRYKASQDSFGELRIMVAGNSYALNQASIIKNSFNGNYKTFDMVSYVPNSVIYSNNQLGEAAQVRTRVTKRLVEAIKPDILFVVTRFSQAQKEIIVSEKIEDDPVVQEYRQLLDFYSNFTKKILIMAPFPLYPMNYLNTIIDDLTRGRSDMHRMQLSKEKADDEMKYSWARIRAINCPKCEIYDLSPNFLFNNTYLGYDPETKASLIDNDIHLTAAGLQRIEAYYKKLAERLISQPHIR